MDAVYEIKTVRELRMNDIVLHPIYRLDGLLFVRKYKRMTESVIGHLRKHFPADYPLLVVESEEKLQQFHQWKEEHGEEAYEQFRHLLTIHQRYTNLPLSMEMYDEQLAKQKPVTDDGQDRFFQAFHPNVFMPMWNVCIQTFDSPRMFQRIKQLNEQLNHTIANDETVLSLFHRMYQYHDVLAVHSVNTMCLSIMIGTALELRDDELLDLALATLFADIGFTAVSKERFIHYLNSGKQNGELMKEHLRLSVEIISTSPHCRRKSIILGILDHHEEYAGTGLPSQKQKEQIHLFGRIIALAQLYDELVGGYIKEESRLSFEAIEEVWKQSGKKIDPNILRIFIDKSRVYKVGEWIQLPTHELGEVIGFKDYVHFPLHPIVKKRNGDIYDLSARL
ncbi:HD-GYP domain-containing protein [Anoxybacteroides amylolyticum]|uniref:HD domain protein n=1 Tax=Anoxybacteroides amylolyticum TaxID=294699 RepID=A0A167SZY1_9BACL|nr:HD domain-containing phosphohydrolase [Anoxybacillus amylolyticus]ANB59236.1 HD domain protein [Anoxybacillus amylolyticus]